MTQDKSIVSTQPYVNMPELKRYRRAASLAAAVFSLTVGPTVAGIAQTRAGSGFEAPYNPVAQLLNRPPANVPEGDDIPTQPMPAEAGEAGLLVRIDRLENQIRALTGQIEQMQFQQRRLEDVLRKVQQDTEFRFQELHGAPASVIRTPTQTPPPSAPVTGAAGVTAPFAGPVGVPVKRGDAFDPNAEPDAPGAPRPLGSLNGPVAQGGPAPPVAAVDVEGGDPNGPMDLMRPSRPRTAAIANPIQSDAMPSTPRSGGASVATAVPPSVAGRDEFEVGRGLFRQGQYEAAQNAFTGFLQKSPKDARVPDATYWLGETFSQRGRHREAAEQYLKLSTDYPKSPRAPEGLLRLGMSLSALGAKEQACATFQEVGRKYPTAPVGVKTGVDREFKRTKC
jgi:tol-pal system protein YbgF